MNINTVADYRKSVKHGKYAWPGGYPLFYVMSDGDPLCCDCSRSERRSIIDSIAHQSNDGWNTVALTVNWEEQGLMCCHCNKVIESAYGD